MRVVFKKKYKDARGRTYHKGAEESLIREVAMTLIRKRYCTEVVEYFGTGILDKKGSEILKKK